MFKELLNDIIQNPVIYVALFISFASLLFSLETFCKQKHIPRTPKKQNESDYRKRIVNASTGFGVFSITLIVIYELFIDKTNPDISGSGEIIDMQSITLAITGISISLISIISSVLSSKREEKYDKIENSLKESISELQKEKKELSDSLEELKAMQKSLRENSDCLTGLMLTDNMFLEKRKERLLCDFASKSESFFEKYFYIRTLHKNYSANASEDIKIHWYNSIIEQGESLLKDINKQNLSNSFAKTQKYLMLIMISDAYFFLAESNIINTGMCDESTLAGYFDKAEKYFNNAEDLYPDEDGYIANGRGLFAYWKYKYYSSKNETKIGLLDDSINYYEKAIQNNPLKPQYYNNKGVSYLQKAKLEENNDKNLDCAGKCFHEALRLDSRASKASINLGDIAITKIRNAINAQDDILILQDLDIDPSLCNKILENYKTGKRNLDNAISIEPHFVNSYYKKAQLICYFMLFMKKANLLNAEEEKALCEEIELLFDDCKEINPNAKGTYYIKRLYFDVLNDFQKAQEVNNDIKKFNEKNAQSWSKVYGAYCESKQKTSS